jgi:hypothetical protein
MPKAVICVEVMDSGGGDQAVAHRLFSVSECPSDTWMEKFMCGTEEDDAQLGEWREDIIRDFPMNISDGVANRLSAPSETQSLREDGLLKWEDGYRWESRTNTNHQGEVIGIPVTTSGEGMVIGSAWFEMVREAKRRAQTQGVQPPSMWCIMAVEGMVESLRAGGLRPRIIFWIEGGDNG